MIEKDHYTFLLTSVLVASLAAIPARCPAQEQSHSGADEIVAALRPFVDRHSLAGAVTLVADKDKVLSLDTVGYSDVAARRPMSPDSLFWIASQSKPITATALDDARGRRQGAP